MPIVAFVLAAFGISQVTIGAEPGPEMKGVAGANEPKDRDRKEQPSYRQRLAFGSGSDRLEPIVNRKARDDLEKRVTVDFPDVAVPVALDELRRQTGANIVAPPNWMTSNPDVRCTLKIADAPLADVLALVLEQAGGGYVVKNGIIIVGVAGRVTTAVYPVPDLAAIQTSDDAQFIAGHLIKLLENCIDSDSWSENGGVGQIKYESVTMSLTILQTEINHRRIQRLFGNLRVAAEQLPTRTSVVGASADAVLSQLIVAARIEEERYESSNRRPAEQPLVVSSDPPRSDGAGFEVAISSDDGKNRFAAESKVRLHPADAGNQPTPASSPVLLGDISKLPSRFDSEESSRVWKLLQKRVSVDFDDTPVADALAELQKLTGATFNKVHVDSVRQPTLQVADVTLNDVLQLLFPGFGIEHGAICIQSEPVLTTSVYPIADLVVIKGKSEIWANARQIRSVIESTIAGDSWNSNGGNANIVFEPTSVSLVVSQSEDIHQEIDELLTSLRQARGLLSHLSRTIGVTPDDLRDEMALAQLDREVGDQQSGGCGTTLNDIRVSSVKLLLSFEDGAKRWFANAYIPIRSEGGYQREERLRNADKN